MEYILSSCILIGYSNEFLGGIFMYAYDVHSSYNPHYPYYSLTFFTLIQMPAMV